MFLVLDCLSVTRGTLDNLGRAFGTGYGPANENGERVRYSVLACFARPDRRRFLVAVSGLDVPGGVGQPHPQTGRWGWAEAEDFDDLVVVHPVRRPDGSGRTFCHHHVVSSPSRPACRFCLVHPPVSPCFYFSQSRFSLLEDSEV
ncbi:hypothetical protein ABZW30_08040 [Kitasatospora sp. NPDC004669]|uniref:hypothetical protein n=1 Tax=Kitasatospora sp. NPDC004669 TaxID=3154555 RepID=UPI0033AB57F5